MTSRRGRRAREHGVLYYLWLGLSWGLLAFVALVATLVIVVPVVSGATPYTILTGSMRPGLPPGTLVVIKPVDPDDIRIGTVVTYQLHSGEPVVVTHRVIAIHAPNLPGGEPSFTTKGDANSLPDPAPVNAVQVRGELWYSVPWIGWVNNVVNGRQRATVIPVVAGALFVYAAYLVVSGLVGKRRKSRREATADELPAADTTVHASDVPGADEAPVSSDLSEPGGT